MQNIKIRLTRNKKELENVLNLRKTIFIRGQNVPASRELDGLDHCSKHVIIFLNQPGQSVPIGCARIRIIGKTAKLERIGILKKYRSKGIGLLLMKYLYRYCKLRNMRKIELHSQEYVKRFYAKLGFKTKGKTFMDAGIRHIKMERHVK